MLLLAHTRGFIVYITENLSEAAIHKEKKLLNASQKYCSITKICLKQPLKKKTKIANAGQQLFDLHQATICLKIFVLCIFEWPLKTGFIVYPLLISDQ